MLGLSNPMVKEWMAWTQAAWSSERRVGRCPRAREGTGSSGGRNAGRREKGAHVWACQPTTLRRWEDSLWKLWLWGRGWRWGSACQAHTPTKRQRPGKLRLVKRSEVWVCTTPLRNSVMLSWSLTASFFTLLSAPHLPTTSLPRSMCLASWYHCFPTWRTQWQGWFCIGEGSKYRRLHPREYHRPIRESVYRNEHRPKTPKHLPLIRTLCSMCIVWARLLPHHLGPFLPHTHKHLIFW